MKNWEPLVTRETVLFERYIRTQGYAKMFASVSSIKVQNLFIVNHDGLTSIYNDKNEKIRHLKIIKSEYEKGLYNKFLSNWDDALKDFNFSVSQLLKKRDLLSFKKFVKNYQIGRAIVFYTEYLPEVLISIQNKAEINRVGGWHEEFESETSLAWDKLKSFFNDLAKKYDYSFEDLMYFIPQEFYQLVESGVKIDKKILNSRKKYYVLDLNNGIIKFYTGNRAQNIENRELNHLNENKNLNKISGLIVFKGDVQGIVKIVNTIKQMNDMKEGEILVSTMTTPRLISAVKKAAAIVTDEGGVTCHAAIISRELKIPCIVGTKIATQALKDGDQVEVDANKGIIKKL